MKKEKVCDWIVKHKGLSFEAVQRHSRMREWEIGEVLKELYALKLIYVCNLKYYGGQPRTKKGGARIVTEKRR